MKPIAWILLLIATSCNEATDTAQLKADTTHLTFRTTKNNPVNNTAKSAGTYDSLSGCYRYIQKRDTIKLKLTVKDTTVNGELAFDNYQIDGSSGTIQGIIRNNQVIVYYNFASEGMQSVREVVFLFRGKKLVQADTQDMSFRNDTAIYKDHQQINFDTSRIFSPVNCDELF